MLYIDDGNNTNDNDGSGGNGSSGGRGSGNSGSKVGMIKISNNSHNYIMSLLREFGFVQF